MTYLDRLDLYKEEMLAALAESVAMPSVNAEAARNADGEYMPFGTGVYNALIQMLSKGEALGFKSYNDDNYAGHIEWTAPESPASEYFGIVGHLDVVPAGEGWDSDPFEMKRDDSHIYGRGVLDDKGPVVACLYAMKALRDEGIEPAMNIRLVLGLDEETGDISARHYTDNLGHPKMGFTPDGNFPLVNGEMGILVFDLAQKFKYRPAKNELRLTKFEGGNAFNAVPAYAKAVIAGGTEQYSSITDRVRLYSEESGHRLVSRKQGNSLVIEAYGMAAHGAHPWEGLNAVSILMDFLGRVSFASEELNDFISFYNEHIGFDFHGEHIGCGFSDEQSGRLVFNVGIADINEDLAAVTVNIRYPVTCSGDAVLLGIEKTIGDGRIGIITSREDAPIFRDPEDPMVAKMMKAYREETGDEEAMPMVIGGGTYAKMFDNILAFGAEFPGEEATMHQANEKLSIDSLMKMARIYANTIYYLCCQHGL